MKVTNTKKRTKRTPALVNEILERLADGESLRPICRELGLGVQTVTDWRKKDPEFAELYREARLDGCDVIAYQSLEIVDAEPQGLPNGAIDPAWVQRCKVRADQRLKLLACWGPERYGAKVALTGSEGGAVETVTRVEIVPMLPEGKK